MIRQHALIRATPRQVYAALIDEKKHARFTGAPAKISARAGGAFTCYDGYLEGFTLELVPGKRIVQAWRSAGWPAGTFSVVTFVLAKAAGGKTKISFTQAGVPAGDVKAKSAGWRKHYWQPLKKFFEQ